MGLFSSLLQRQLVGLDLGVSGIKAAELVTGGRPRFSGYNRVPLPWDVISSDGEIKERDVVVTALKKLFDSGVFSTRRVAVGVSGNSVITKKIAMPVQSESEVREALYWEAEQYIPFPVNEVTIDFAILGNSATVADSPMMDVLLVAAKRDYVASITSIVKEAGLEPTVIDIQAFALGNAFEFNYGTEDDDAGAIHVIVDFGAGSTKVSVVEGDRTVFARDLRQSGVACSLMISERLGVPIAEAEKLKVTQASSGAVAPVLAEFVATTVDELARTLDFAIAQSPESTIRSIHVCGGASLTAGLLEALEERMPVPVERLNPVQNIAGAGNKLHPQAVKEIGILGAVAVGLALRTEGDAG
jgi:type IV pilus assembly protein PilM